ncbi:MAG: hypothetical protein AB1449_12405 [Chloroflexota bacterium]
MNTGGAIHDRRSLYARTRRILIDELAASPALLPPRRTEAHCGPGKERAL